MSTNAQNNAKKHDLKVQRFNKRFAHRAKIYI